VTVGKPQLDELAVRAAVDFEHFQRARATRAPSAGSADSDANGPGDAPGAGDAIGTDSADSGAGDAPGANSDAGGAGDAPGADSGGSGAADANGNDANEEGKEPVLVISADGKGISMVVVEHPTAGPTGRKPCWYGRLPPKSRTY
jgi:hypothetical protein